MRSLIFDVHEPPSPCEQVSDLSSWPGLLLEGKHHWQRLAAESPQHLLEEAQRFQPAVIALVGQQEACLAWAALCEQLLPRLFVLPHPPADDHEVIDAINQRAWILRRRRLAEHRADPPSVQSSDPGQLFATLFPAEKRQSARGTALDLLKFYRLAEATASMDAETVERGATLLALLDSHLPELPAAPAALDYGCSMWSYAPFLQAFLSSQGPAALTGLEPDPWFLQPDGRLRGDWARYWAGRAGAEYIEGEPGKVPLLGNFDLITWLRPLLQSESALRAGLPLERHDPGTLLQRLRRLLRPGGQLLMYMAEEADYQAAIALLQQANWRPRDHGTHHCPLREQDWGWCIRLQA